MGQGDPGVNPRPTLNGVNAPSVVAPGDPAAEALETRRARYLVLLTVLGLLGEAVGSYLVLLSGYCPRGDSCLVQEAVGAVFVGAGFLAVIGVGVLGSLLLALALSCLGVGAGALAGGTQGAGWVGLVVGGEFVAMGLILLGVQQWQARRRRRIAADEAALWQVGRPGRAAVLDVDDAGRRAGRMRIVTLTLRIDPGDGGELYTVEVDHRVAPGMVPQPGDLHDVRLDPQDRTRLAVGPRQGPAQAPGQA